MGKSQITLFQKKKKNPQTRTPTLVTTHNGFQQKAAFVGKVIFL